MATPLDVRVIAVRGLKPTATGRRNGYAIGIVNLSFCLNPDWPGFYGFSEGVILILSIL